jgi:hypothetical protein
MKCYFMMPNMANFIVRNKNTCVLKNVPMFGLWTFLLSDFLLYLVTAFFFSFFFLEDYGFFLHF